MTDRKITDEQLLEELSNGNSNRGIAKKYGMNRTSIEQRRALLKEKGLIPSGEIVKGTSTLYDDDGNVKIQWVKTKASKALNEEQEQAILDAFIDKLPQVEPTKQRLDEGFAEDLMAVYPLGDPHVGMLAWAEECGANWDLKIAEQTLCQGFSNLVSSSPRCSLGVIVNLGDFFHYDNIVGLTERSGNVLDRDGRYAKMVQVGIKIMRQMIETALRHHNRVKVINCVGNHDETGALWLSLCLAHIYENEPRIEIDTSPTPFHYIRFGKVLIGTHHGHTAKLDKLPGIMASTRAKDWGETLYRHWLTGHIHNDSKREIGGCYVESFRTLAAADSFATWHGYVSGRSSQAIVYSKNSGEKYRYIFQIEELMGE